MDDLKEFVASGIQVLKEVAEANGYAKCKLDALEMVERFIDASSDNADKSAVLRLLWYSLKGMERDE